MLILVITLIEAVLITFLCLFLFNLTLWVEVLVSILIGVFGALLLRGVFFYIQIYTASRLGARAKFTKIWGDRMIDFVFIFLNISIKKKGIENIPKGPCVFFGNHKSLIDFFVAYRSTKEVITFVAKKEILDSKFVNRYINAIDCVCIDRANDRAAAESLIKVIKSIKSGNKAFIFPEGQRTDKTTNNMLKGRAGSYKMPLKAKVPIVPVSIRNNHLVSKRVPWKRTKVEIIYHEAISYENYKDLNTNQIEEMVRKVVNSAFEG